MEDSGREMPRYRCHKEVWALKIKAVNYDREQAATQFPSAEIWPEESGYAPIRVDSEFVRKHDPKAGMYFVVYNDGYRSASPAKAFEEGYTRI
jgi:hypothetical protein